MFEGLTGSLTRALSALRKPGSLSAREVEAGLRVVRRALLEADVHFRVATEFTRRVGLNLEGKAQLEGQRVGAQFAHAVHEELERVFDPGIPVFPNSAGDPRVLLFVGLQGTGKTTSLAKVASRLLKEGRKPILAACDLRRPAAAEQLATLGEALGVPVCRADAGGNATSLDVAHAALERAKLEGQTDLLVDSSGRLHIDEDLMDEIVALEVALNPAGVFLVVDAMAGQDALESAKGFSDRLSLYGVVLAKADGDSRGGAALSVREATGVPILFLGSGEDSTDLELVDPKRLAGRILDMGDMVGLAEKALQAREEEGEPEDPSAFLSGEFSLEDMLKQFRSMKRMGSAKKLLGMMPGASRMSGLLESLDDKKFDRFEAILLSMTPEERMRPDILDGSRRKRIARGAGVSPEDVNSLFRSFREMKKQMKALGRVLGGAKSSKKLKRLLGGGKGFPGF